MKSPRALASAVVLAVAALGFLVWQTVKTMRGDAMPPAPLPAGRPQEMPPAHVHSHGGHLHSHDIARPPTATQQPFTYAPTVPRATTTPRPATGGPATARRLSNTAAAAEIDAVRSDLERVRSMIRDYRSLAGENPVGTNAEIMQAMRGGNKKGARLGPPEGQKLNGGGELLDRWGTPYFFHQLSKTDMEIRSAGPDRMMWTADDHVTK